MFLVDVQLGLVKCPKWYDNVHVVVMMFNILVNDYGYIAPAS